MKNEAGWKIIYSKDNTYVARVRPTPNERVEFQVFSICQYSMENVPLSLVADGCSDTDDFEQADVIAQGEFRWDLDLFLTMPEEHQTSARDIIALGTFLTELKDALSDGSFLRLSKAKADS